MPAMTMVQALNSAMDVMLERGYNNLWTKGGLIYAMPIR